MASISRDKNGNRRVQFTAPDGKRQTIRLGDASQRAAEAIKYRVQQLLIAKLTGHALETDTVKWLNKREKAMLDKLARVGLIPKPKAKEAMTLEAFIESYISRRNDVSPHTRRIWRQTKRLLGKHFGEQKALHEITPGDAADWRLSLVEAKMADASVRKHCGFAKHFFARAVDHELIASNPFAKLVSAPVGNSARQYFVTREETAKILAASPNAEWRLIIALSRYGGLRCPSEHLGLTWADINWAENKITVRSPKTAKHSGHESRVIPLFPELRPYLEAVFDAAEPGTEKVIPRQNANANLRTQLKRIIENAGLKPWPRITHNLRASRATELAADYPAHVAAAWLGHSTLVAQKHYWTVTDDDFQRAIKSDAESDARVTQNATQQVRAPNCTESHKQSATPIAPLTYAQTGDGMQMGATDMAEVHGNRTHRS